MAFTPMRATSEGDITTTEAVVWSYDRDTPYVPSPLLYEDTLCFMKHYQGILTCVAAKSGVLKTKRSS